MGLHVRTIARLPIPEDRDYFVYVLDYGWDAPIEQTLRNNFDRLAAFCADHKAVAVAGFPDSHFENEVFSWHGVNGLDGENVLPAIMVTRLHPSYFAEKFNSGEDNTKNLERLLLVPLRKVCKTADDVVVLIESLMSDMSSRRDLADFQVAKDLSSKGRFVDSLILEPNISGIGVNIPKLLQYLGGR